MKSFETHLAESGTTTVPKSLRHTIGAPGAGRLVWALQPDGSLVVRLKHAYPKVTAFARSQDGAAR